MKAPAGYSGTPLPKKLGLKDGQRAAFIALPETLADLAVAVDFMTVRRLGTATEARSLEPRSADFIHGFFESAAALQAALPRLKSAIDPGGMIWISWPKKASKRPTDITEDTIRTHALPIGLVDIKVCAVDEIWSGLKLVIRKELRDS